MASSIGLLKIPHSLPQTTRKCRLWARDWISIQICWQVWPTFDVTSGICQCNTGKTIYILKISPFSQLCQVAVCRLLKLVQLVLLFTSASNSFRNHWKANLAVQNLYIFIYNFFPTQQKNNKKNCWFLLKYNTWNEILL